MPLAGVGLHALRPGPQLGAHLGPRLVPALRPGRLGRALRYGVHDHGWGMLLGHGVPLPARRRGGLQ